MVEVGEDEVEIEKKGREREREREEAIKKEVAAPDQMRRKKERKKGDP